jgi:hypothetical protein
MELERIKNKIITVQGRQVILDCEVEIFDFIKRRRKVRETHS